LAEVENIEIWQDPETIQTILHNARTVAVVGLSSNPLRASNFVGFYARRHGYRVIPVNPRESEVFGERSWPSLSDIPEPVDVVDVFRAPDAVPDIVRESIAINAKALWLQFGVIHEEAATEARAAGLDVVMDRCLKIEHARYIGRMHVLGFNTDTLSARREVPT